jgi:uncharacterized protein
VRCYYASDVHGSEVCWRKFLNAGKHYRADVLIMGGDIIGKAIVPIVQNNGHSTSRFHRRDVALESESAIQDFEKQVRNAGYYPARLTPDEVAHLDQSDEARTALFERVVRHELQRWLAIAAEKADRKIRVYVIPGNDDPWWIDEELKNSAAVIFCDRQVVLLEEEVEMVSLSYANPTPWDSPRECSEEQLTGFIDELLVDLRQPELAIFNFHVPPYGSGLDEAPRLDESMRPVTHLGHVEVMPVGSRAVREAIERYQPLVSVHGHIHESRAIQKIGRTVAINPGSEYGSGRIHGALFEIKKGKLKSNQLVVG